MEPYFLTQQAKNDTIPSYKKDFPPITEDQVGNPFSFILFSEKPSVQEGPDGLWSTVIPGRDLDSASSARCVDDLSIADVHGNMVDPSAAASVEDQVARLHLARLDPFSAVRLGTGVMRKGDSEVFHNRHRKSGTVRALCKARTTPDIWIAQELHRIVYDPAS